MSTVEFYIFRHGETDWNAQRKFQGHTDIPLNENGQKQAQTLIDKISRINPEICLSSDLIRAVETAKIAFDKKKIDYVYSPLLRETHLGDVEGMHVDQIISQFGEEMLLQWRSVSAENLHMSFPGGETKFQHLQRLQKCLIEFTTSNSHYKKIAVSSHGGSVIRLAHSCEDAPSEAIAIPNCCLYQLDFNLKTHKWSFKGQL